MISDQRPLVLAIIDALMLLENSPDSDIDPDTAVKGMESIADSLHQLQTGDQIEFRNVLAEIADSGTDPARLSFIRGADTPSLTEMYWEFAGLARSQR